MFNQLAARHSPRTTVVVVVIIIIIIIVKYAKQFIPFVFVINKKFKEESKMESKMNVEYRGLSLNY